MLPRIKWALPSFSSLAVLCATENGVGQGMRLRIELGTLLVLSDILASSLSYTHTHTHTYTHSWHGITFP